MAYVLIQLGIFALIAGLLFRYPQIGMHLHPEGSHPVRKHAWQRYYRDRFNFVAQSFIAAGAGLFTLGLFTI